MALCVIAVAQSCTKKILVELPGAVLSGAAVMETPDMNETWNLEPETWNLEPETWNLKQSRYPT